MPGNGNKGGGGSATGPLSLSGNRKDNILVGSDYGDNIRGFEGNDVLIGKGNDKDGGIDLLIGGDGNDILIGDSGTVSDPTAESANDGTDRLFGGAGDDALYGGGGDDELQGGDGFDILDGGSGYDLALYSADDEAIVVTPTANGFTIDFVGDLPTETAVNTEGVVGTYYDDVLNGATDRMNTLNGYYGNDTINGGALTDWLDGHGDNDTIDGKGGDDVIAGGSGNDNLTGGDGADTFVFWGASGNDTITDFELGIDKLDFSSSGLDFSDLTISGVNSGADTQISDGSGNSVTLSMIDSGELQESDFIFA